MNVLGLFEGISSGYEALSKLGFTIDRYYASEVDKYAIAISKYNFPNIIRLGNINNWGKWNIDYSKIDLLLAGFSCQPWSFAGKQQGLKDPRGQLIFPMLKILQKCKESNPSVKFLFENVKMKKENNTYLNSLFGVEPIEINSALVSAQNRKRLYWTNISGIKQPKNKKIYLKDIIESGFVDRKKSYCIDAHYFNGGNLKQYFQKSRRQLVFEKPQRVTHCGNGGQGQRVYSIKGKSVTLSAHGGGWGAKTGLYLVPVKCGAIRGRYLDSSKLTTTKMLEIRKDNKTNALTTVQKDNVLVFYDGQYYTYRKLTPLECERLQTLPDNFTKYGMFENGKIKQISNSQKYKCLDNGWTVNIIKHILKNIII